MKKKIIAVALTCVLVVSLSTTAFAANGSSGNGSFPTSVSGTDNGSDNGTQMAARTHLRANLGTMAANRTMSRNLLSENRSLGDQLRNQLHTMITDDTELSDEMLTELNTLKAELQSLHDELAATKGGIADLLVTYRAYKQADDLKNADAVLDQIIAIQNTRIDIKTDISTLLDKIIALLA